MNAAQALENFFSLILFFGGNEPNAECCKHLDITATDGATFAQIIFSYISLKNHFLHAGILQKSILRES